MLWLHAMVRGALLLVVLMGPGCRTVAPVPPEPRVEFATFERTATGLVIEQGVVSLPGAPLRPGSFVRPLDSTLSLAAIARALKGSSVRGVSLSGWPRLEGLEQLCDATPLEWLDLSRTTLTGALGVLKTCSHLSALVVNQARVAEADVVALNPLRSFDARETALGDGAVVTLSAWPALEELGLSKTKLTDAALPLLATKTTLTRLELADTEVGPVGVLALAPLVDLRVLDLGATAVNDEALVVLDGFERLESLSLASTVTSDAGLQHLRKLTRLTSLNLSDTRITDAGLAGLEDAVHLEALLLATTSITDVTGKRLSALRALRLLDLGETKVTNETARVIGALETLEELSLRKTDVDDFGVAAMRGLVGLRMVDLERTQVSSTSLPVLGGFVRLRELDLSGDLLHDAKLSELSSLTQLDTLRLAQSFLPVEEVKSLPNVASLRTLDLSNLPVTDVEVQWLAEHAPRLELLKLNFTKVGDAGVAALGGLGELRRVDLGRAGISDAGLAALVRAPKLTSLDLGLCTTLSPAGLRTVSSTHLESLFLAGTLADDALVGALPGSVRALGLMKSKVTRAAVPALMALPVLREVDLRELTLSEDDVKPLLDRGVSVSVGVVR